MPSCRHYASTSQSADKSTLAAQIDDVIAPHDDADTVAPVDLPPTPPRRPRLKVEDIMFDADRFVKDLGKRRLGIVKGLVLVLVLFVDVL